MKPKCTCGLQRADPFIETIITRDAACPTHGDEAMAGKLDRLLDEVAIPELTEQELANLAKKHTPIADWPDEPDDLIQDDALASRIAKQAHDDERGAKLEGDRFE